MPEKNAGKSEKKPVRVPSDLLDQAERIAIEESARTGTLLTLSEMVEKLLTCGIEHWKRDK